jgi:hypothetical protein
MDSKPDRWKKTFRNADREEPRERTTIRSANTLQTVTSLKYSREVSIIKSSLSDALLEGRFGDMRPLVAASQPGLRHWPAPGGNRAI